MASNRREDFLKEDLVLSDFAKSMGHPARIAILKELAERNECICGEIVELLPLAQSTVSQHIQELKKAGLVKGSVNGVKSCYCINWENFEKLSEQLKAYLDLLNQHNLNNKCC